VCPEERFGGGFMKSWSHIRTPNGPESLLKAALEALDNGDLPLGGVSGRLRGSSEEGEVIQGLSKRLAPILGTHPRAPILGTHLRHPSPRHPSSVARRSPPEGRGPRSSPVHELRNRDLLGLPCWEHLSPEAYRERVGTMARKIEEEAAAARKRTGAVIQAPGSAARKEVRVESGIGRDLLGLEGQRVEVPSGELSIRPGSHWSS
jgi:hypothetical protein